MIKFNSHDHFLEYMADLNSLYMDQSVINQLEEQKAKSDEPTIIKKDISDIPQICQVESISDYNAMIVDSMPRTNYTIDYRQDSICITFTVKNTGITEWPSAFMIHLLE
mmetsp:Transcript_6557/g.6116  ORF Transcript_6557/g.6116 Transcript_6557/m.6116 type:complete len:109 (+) Transcript_6557:401-727(+)